MTLGEAKTAGEILGVLARREWYLKHKDKPELRNECPDSMIPAAPDLAAWLPECPEGAQAEANRLLVDFFDAVRWFAMQRLASIPFEVAATGMVTDSDGTLVEAEVFPRGAKVEPVLILSGLAHLVETWRWEVVRTGQADRIMMGVVEEGFGVVGSGKSRRYGPT